MINEFDGVRGINFNPRGSGSVQIAGSAWLVNLGIDVLGDDGLLETNLGALVGFSVAGFVVGYALLRFASAAGK